MRWPWPALAAAVAALAWGAAFAWLQTHPEAGLEAARGVFARDTPGAPFSWTSSRVALPIRPGSGPTQTAITLAAGGWPGRAPAEAALSGDRFPAIALVLEDRPRRVLALLPPDVRELRLDVRADPAPGGDRRYLGVRLYAFSARTTGWPVTALLAALGWAALGGCAALALSWCARRGWGLIGAATLAGLALRLLELDRLPPGFFQDEAVGAVDALSLLATGRDHLGHWLPLGAFEAFGDWVSPLLTYAQLPSVGLLGPTPLAARLPGALVGALAVPAIYLAGRELGLPRWAAALAGLAAAISPWQILRSRVASPPALVPLCWALCLWAGLRLIRLRTRRSALLLALTAGIGLYSYPTMKLAVPLLAAAAVALALHAEYALQSGSVGQRARLQVLLQASGELLRRWWPAALALAVLWLPFAQLTLGNEDSAMRASRKLLRADSWAEWIGQWLAGYSVYFRPAFYYISGDPSNGIEGQGVELVAGAPLLLAGLCALILAALGQRAGPIAAARYRLVLLATLVAPLPASLMAPNPQLTRALILAPMVALLVGIGGAWLAGFRDQERATLSEEQTLSAAGRPLTWVATARLRQLIVGALVAAMLAGGLARFADYRERFPELTARKYQDGTLEAFERLVELAPGYDQVWVDDRMPFPYIYVLAAGGVAPAEAQATIVVDRPGTTFNTVRAVGRYRFVDFKPIPERLPALAATVNSLGEPGFVIQEWRDGNARVLLLRRMR